MSSAVMSKTFGRVVCAGAPIGTSNINMATMAKHFMCLISRHVRRRIGIAHLDLAIEQRLELLRRVGVRGIVREIVVLLRIGSVVVKLNALGGVVAPLGVAELLGVNRAAPLLSAS